MNKISETKRSKDNCSRAANAGNNKNKEYNRKKKDRQSNTKSSANKNLSVKCTYFIQDGHFADK